MIRLAKPEDKEALIDIVARCWNHQWAARADIELDQAFRGYDWRPVLYVEEWKGEVVGCAAFVASWAFEGVYDLTWVAVHPEFQGRGIGKALVERCLDAIAPMGHMVILSTDKPGFYARHWLFRAIDRHIGDQVLMSMNLSNWRAMRGYKA